MSRKATAAAAAVAVAVILRGVQVRMSLLSELGRVWRAIQRDVPVCYDVPMHNASR